MAITTLSGLNSGLNISDMVTAMVNAEKAPKESQLSRLSATTTTKFTALGTLKGALSEFQTAMKDLNSAALFEKRTATSSNASALTATAGKTATAASYQIEVNSLAVGSKVATAAQSSSFSSGDAEQVITVKLGEDDVGVEVRIAAGSDLASIRDQLNEGLKDKGVTVNTINDPATGKARLVFSGSETGTGKDVIVSGTGDLAVLDADGRTALDASSADAAGYIVKAANAEFTIDGLALSSATNKVTDAIADVSFDLLAKTEAGKPLTLKVGQDTSGVKAAVTKFVDAYNKLITTSNQLTAVTKVSDDAAPVTGGLVGDATVRSLLSSIRTELVNASGSDGIRVLADMGITTQNDGKLTIDDTKLDAVIKDNFEAVGAFFTGETGLMSRVDKRIDGFIQTGGIIEQRQKALQSTLTDIDKQKEKLNLRVEQMQTRLLAQFNAMDALVGQLNNTSSQLDQALSNLPGVVKKSK
ncbi:flagellar filament capping protein FliD [Phytopseudomonas dryadis]|uniref:Flagellar hook-associated protein 2 n=1 Tax=Phytopseudomonas dryadis TaxID=2487520 RepID=A0A4V2KCE8_9GAMM|nr:MULTISPECIES: flagellar filament capping protein FliD [Pseudomonas]TBU93897.1 A-type flagellar hook-associated protein 2 [Pseudomonas dryadis]TBV07941.1 A-type flagellar hook-associated protein 2 [Pseudomonas dryadis]TBV19336.1 A-type flagellar hook-associated protein 2 [Pseudomonas sp. FRB 230]